MYRNKSKMDFIWTTTIHEISGGNYLVWLTRIQRLLERNAYCPSSLVGNFQLNRHKNSTTLMSNATCRYLR